LQFSLQTASPETFGYTPVISALNELNGWLYARFIFVLGDSTSRSQDRTGHCAKETQLTSSAVYDK